MILYVICFDLSKSIDELIKQITYWLDFLHSALPLPPSPVLPNRDWGILLVGLRADEQKPSSPQIQLAQIAAWQRMWPRLSILNQQVHNVSSIESEESVRQLLITVERVCTKVFSNHTMEIPTLYRSTLQKIQKSLPSSSLLITEDVLYADHGTGIDRQVFTDIMYYLDAIGSIVRLSGGLICVDPQSIPKLAAKFVSRANKINTFERKHSNSHPTGCWIYFEY